MPIYEYKALTDLGKVSTGVLDADTVQDARSKLRSMRLHPTDVRPTRQPGKDPLPSGRRPLTDVARLEQWMPRRRIRDLPVLTRQMATLLKAGIPLVESLSALIDQTEDLQTEKVLRRVRERIQGGASFAEALEEHAGLFGDLYVNMVRAGEIGGNLDIVLADLAHFTQKQHSLRNKVSAALAYPVFLALFASGVVAFLLTNVVPTLEGTLVAQGKTLPLTTTLLLQVSAFVRHGWWLIGLGVFAAVGGVRTTLKNPAGRLFWDTHKLRLPLAGNVFKKQAISRFATTLATLLKSGIPAVEALRITRKVVDNALLAQVVDTIANKIVEGTDIAGPLKKSGIFPPVVSYMIAIGEESGQLEEILRTLSATYEEEVELALQKFTSLLEPIMIAVMAAVVGFIVYAIVMPIMDLSNIR